MSDHASSSYDHGNVETGVGAAMIALSIIFVVLRFYTRRHTKAGLGWDDWFALMALCGNIAAALLVLAGEFSTLRCVALRCSSSSAMTTASLSPAAQVTGLFSCPVTSPVRHHNSPSYEVAPGSADRSTASAVDPDSDWIEDNTDMDYHYTAANQTHLKLAWIASILYYSLVSAAKLSILLLYDRVFSASRYFHGQIQVFITITSCFWIATTIACIFNCWPLKYSWLTNASPAPYCFNFNVFWFATGVIEAVLDVCIILLPARMIIKLQMSVRNRLSMVAVFSLGAL